MTTFDVEIVDTDIDLPDTDTLFSFFTSNVRSSVLFQSCFHVSLTIWTSW